MAKSAWQEATDGVDRAFQDPTPWLRKSFTYTCALGKNRDAIEADVGGRPSRSIVMKYAMGSGTQIRRPGDVGLAQDEISPHWKNFGLTQGIQRNSYGNLPHGVAARLTREVRGLRA